MYGLDQIGNTGWKLLKENPKELRKTPFVAKLRDAAGRLRSRVEHPEAYRRDGWRHRAERDKVGDPLKSWNRNYQKGQPNEPLGMVVTALNI